MVKCWIGEMALSSRAIGRQFFYVVRDNNSQEPIYKVYRDGKSIDTYKVQYHDKLTQWQFLIPENTVIRWHYKNSGIGCQ